jgi:hypothetical protein
MLGLPSFMLPVYMSGCTGSCGVVELVEDRFVVGKVDVRRRSDHRQAGDPSSLVFIAFLGSIKLNLGLVLGFFGGTCARQKKAEKDLGRVVCG